MIENDQENYKQLRDQRGDFIVKINTITESWAKKKEKQFALIAASEALQMGNAPKLKRKNHLNKIAEPKKNDRSAEQEPEEDEEDELLEEEVVMKPDEEQAQCC